MLLPTVHVLLVLHMGGCQKLSSLLGYPKYIRCRMRMGIPVSGSSIARVQKNKNGDPKRDQNFEF